MKEVVQFVSKKKKTMPVMFLKAPLDQEGHVKWPRKSDKEVLVKFGDYSILQGANDGSVNEIPFPTIMPEVNEEERLVYVGATYFQGRDGYYYIGKNDHRYRFTDFTIIIIERRVVFQIDGKKTAQIMLDLKGEGRKDFRIKINEDQWSDLPTIIEKKAPFFQIFTDEIPNAREKLKRLSGILLQQSSPSEKKVQAFWGWSEKNKDDRRLFYHGGRADCMAEKTLLAVIEDPNTAADILHQALGIFDVGPRQVVVPLVLYAAAGYMDALFSDAGYPLAHCMMLVGDSGLMKTSFCREVFNS